MPDLTDRIQLSKPLNSELWSNAVWNANWEQIDDLFGTVICTSSTRPSSPYPGQTIYETDTHLSYVRNAANTFWSLQSAIPSVSATSDIQSPYAGQVIFVTGSGANVFYRYTGSTWSIHTLFSHASSNSVATADSCTSTTYAALATAGPAVTLTSTGTRALVMIRCKAFGTSGTYRGIAASFAVSGATTISASDASGAMCTANQDGYGFTMCAWQEVVITPGANTYTMQYKTSSLTATISDRKIWVVAP